MMSKSKFCVVATKLLACFLVFPLTGFAVDNAISIGILEEGDTPPGYQHELRYGVRLLFEKTETGWKSICESKSDKRNDGCNFQRVEDSVDWYVQLGGEQLGTIRTQGWLDSEFYSQTGLLRITTTSVPTVGERSDLFAGWTGAPVHRPLVATTTVSKKSVRKCEVSKGTPQTANNVWPIFHTYLPKVEICLVDKEGNQTGVNSRPTIKKDVEISSVWKSNEGNRLIHASINRDAFKDCDGPLDSQVDIWLYQPLNGAMQVLPGQFNDSISPLDFGNFGGDDDDAAVFLVEGYNEGGYALYYDHFQKQVKFTWGYH